jgi:hypothetical protein
MTGENRSKGKAIPLQVWTGPGGFQEFGAARFQDNRHMTVVSNGRLYSPGNIPGTHFFQWLSQPQSHSAAGSIMSMKYSSDTIGNRTRDLPTCNAVSQPAAPPRAPKQKYSEKKSVPGSLCPPQIPHGLAWDRVRASAVRGRRLIHGTFTEGSYKIYCRLLPSHASASEEHTQL